jgi:hemerythrin
MLCGASKAGEADGCYDAVMEQPAAFEWQDSFAIGVAEIDEQHRRLIGAINDFYTGLHYERSQEALAKLLKFLIDYIAMHFRTEEALMARHGYPGQAAHKEQHLAFEARVAQMAERYISGKLLLSLEVTRFLRQWLTEHILHTDKELGLFLSARGEH